MVNVPPYFGSSTVELSVVVVEVVVPELEQELNNRDATVKQIKKQVANVLFIDMILILLIFAV
jgi:hypothetical protein